MRNEKRNSFIFLYDVIIILLIFNSGYIFSQNKILSTAEYTVTFNSTWSASTHPDQFPSNPHFSGLIGGTHNSNILFWESGKIASSGIERMAEIGAKDSLTSIVQREINLGNADQVLSGNGINPSPGQVVLTFNINSDYPLVTLVSMVAPSPDWFVGVSGLNLYENNNWIANKTVELFVWDAGTDNGTIYTSPDSDTQPKENIKIISESPFLVNGSIKSIGSFTFIRNSITGVDDNFNNYPTEFFLYQNFPNPFNPSTKIKYSIPSSKFVSLIVYDIYGKEIKKLVNEYKKKGSYIIEFNGELLSTGVYFYQLKTDLKTITQKMLLLK